MLPPPGNVVAYIEASMGPKKTKKKKKKGSIYIEHKGALHNLHLFHGH